MARTDTLANFVTDVANAIRNKSGKSDLISPSDFDTEITNLPSGGSTPEKGYVVNQIDSNGYATKVTVYGLTTLPECAFCGIVSNSITYRNILNLKLAEVVLPNTLTTISNKSFYSCPALKKVNLPESITSIASAGFMSDSLLELDELPSSLTSIGAQAFQGCKKITIKTIPDGVKNLQLNTFYGCTGMTQISMRNVTTVYSGSTNNAFYNCTGLKAVWMGSAVTSSGLGQYSFKGCTNITKMYIDLPRATVEAFTGYQYAFMNDTTKTGIIICNDDEGFMTKEEFDAIDWSVA